MVHGAGSDSDQHLVFTWLWVGDIFAAQNFEMVTMSFLGFNARVPLALLVAVAYLLGAATGGSLFALLRRSYEGSRRSIVGSS